MWVRFSSSVREPALLCLLTVGLAACKGRDDDDAASEPATEDSEPAPDSAAPAEPPDLALVADSSNGRYLYLRLDTGTVAREIRLATLHPELCDAKICAAFGGWPSVDQTTGLDELTVTFTPPASADSGEAIVEKLRLHPSGEELVWRLDSLDFLTNFPDRPELCAQTTACGVPTTSSEEERRLCQLALSHEVKVIEEDEASVRMWIADTASPSRALKVRLDKASTCGVVEDVLSEATATSWDGIEAVNDVDVVDLGDGQETLLINNLTRSGEGGRASVTFWQKVEGTWTLLWQHPSAASGGYLSAAHNPDWMVAEDGLPYVVYAHSNGMGRHGQVEQFNGRDDHLGSVGVGRVTAAGVDYLFDATIPDTLGFVRDVNLLSDGSFLVTDSGCMHPEDSDCDHAGQLWRLSLPDLAQAEATGLSGAFSPDKSEMVVVRAQEVDASVAWPLQCELLTPYSAQWISGADLGATLRADTASPGSACEAD